jgi:ABC-2 type transport system ATP-binding protein
MISAQGLTKYYGERAAIEDLSFTIEDGEIVGILGLNGAGKTTTLRILACLLLPSSGSVQVNGMDVVENPHEIRKLVGFLPETPPLYGEMRVEDFLLFAARLRGLGGAEAKRRLEEVLEATNIGDVRKQIIDSLSHGYRQRVGIAQAVVHNPAVLILDEPIQGLDPGADRRNARAGPKAQGAAYDPAIEPYPERNPPDLRQDLDDSRWADRRFGHRRRGNARPERGPPPTTGCQG